jgi:hypothetical protein
MKPDPYAVALQEFFRRFNFNKITLREDDVQLIAAWISQIPPSHEYLRDEFAFGFARAFDLLRRQRDLRWTN